MPEHCWLYGLVCGDLAANAFASFLLFLWLVVFLGFFCLVFLRLCRVARLLVFFLLLIFFFAFPCGLCLFLLPFLLSFLCTQHKAHHSHTHTRLKVSKSGLAFLPLLLCVGKGREEKKGKARTHTTHTHTHSTHTTEGKKTAKT